MEGVEGWGRGNCTPEEGKVRGKGGVEMALNQKGVSKRVLLSRLRKEGGLS